METEMDVGTLLTRQMELHSSVRRPPTNADQLVQLRDNMRNYYQFFHKMREYATELNTEADTLFQCFMYISVGGAVSFDAQHQDGSVPMHQAKVLTRESAIELEPVLRERIPHEELMVYVGLCRDVRAALRVKIEDGNDIRTAEKNVTEAVEYLNFIDSKSGGDKNKLYAFYMVEDEDTLLQMLEESGDVNFAGTYRRGSNSGGAAFGVSAKPGNLDKLLEEDVSVPLPPLPSFLKELKAKADVAKEVQKKAGDRLKATQIISSWVSEVDTDYFAAHMQDIFTTLAVAVEVLTKEKRSALCRCVCDLVTLLMGRVSLEPAFLKEVEAGTGPIGSVLGKWTTSLTKGVYVTVSAISQATDKAVREVAIESHGHPLVAKAILTALESGTQTELRRKCLGYLALCVSAATYNGGCHHLRSISGPIVEAGVKHVDIGDSPSRKMARALCAVVAAATSEKIPITNERTAKLIEMEKAKVLHAMEGGPRDLEGMLFEANELVASSRVSLTKSQPGSPVLHGSGFLSKSAHKPAPAKMTPKTTVSQPQNLDDRPLPKNLDDRPLPKNPDDRPLPKNADDRPLPQNPDDRPLPKNLDDRPLPAPPRNVQKKSTTPHLSKPVHQDHEVAGMHREHPGKRERTSQSRDTEKHEATSSPKHHQGSLPPINNNKSPSKSGSDVPVPLSLRRQSGTHTIHAAPADENKLKMSSSLQEKIHQKRSGLK